MPTQRSKKKTVKGFGITKEGKKIDIHSPKFKNGNYTRVEIQEIISVYQAIKDVLAGLPIKSKKK